VPLAVPTVQGDQVLRRLTTLATSVALGLALVAFAPPAAVTTAAALSAAPSNSARLGAAYLARQIDANDGHIVSFGSPDIANTAYAVLGLHAAGIGAHESDRAIAFLKTQLGNLQGSDGSDDPAMLGYITMAAVASGQNPRRFGGQQPANDLVARLLATIRVSGSDAGLFGSADPTFDGAFRQGVALAALSAAHVGERKVASAIAWLERQQCADALWTSYRSDTSTRCPAADPSTFEGPDTNSSSMAVQGLAAYGMFPHAARVVSSLHSAKSSDGGYPFIAAPGQSSDPDSTALVIQALLAEHVRPGSAVDALFNFQLACSDPAAARGAFFFPGDRTPNTFATVQSVPAMALRTLPLAPSVPSARVPTETCPSATATSSIRAGIKGACAGTSGVTVTVDFTAFGGREQTRCALGAQSSGIAALENAGFTPAGTTRYGLAFVCRINNLPTPAQQACVTTPPATAYWAYYHASAGAKTWTFSTVGASSYVPPLGSIDAWAFGDSALPSKTPAQVRRATS
jgi:hypothetical protein